MRNCAASRPSRILHHLQRSQIFTKPIRKRAIELKPVSVRTHTSVPQQIACVLVAEKIFPGSHRPRIKLSQRRLQSEVEWITRLFIPKQWILPQHPGIRNRSLEVEASVGINR